MYIVEKYIYEVIIVYVYPGYSTFFHIKTIDKNVYEYIHEGSDMLYIRMPCIQVMK